MLNVFTLRHAHYVAKVVGVELEYSQQDVGQAETEHAEHEALALQITQFRHWQIHEQCDQEEEWWNEETRCVYRVVVALGWSVFFRETYQGNI